MTALLWIFAKISRLVDWLTWDLVAGRSWVKKDGSANATPTASQSNIRFRGQRTYNRALRDRLALAASRESWNEFKEREELETAIREMIGDEVYEGNADA